MNVKATVLLVRPIAAVLLGVTEETVGHATILTGVAHPSDKKYFHFHLLGRSKQMLSKYAPVIVFYQWISEIASPVAISFIRSIFTLGKAVAAKNIFYATAAVLTVPNIQLVAEKM